MKFIPIIFVIAISVICSTLQAQHVWDANNLSQKQLIRLDPIFKRMAKDMVHVEGGTFTMGRTSEYYVNMTDSNLLSRSIPRRVTLNSFHIWDHEITNGEYREFVTWVNDSIKNQRRKENPNATIPFFTPADQMLYTFETNEFNTIINIYPDTACWVRELPYAYNEPMKTNYWSHPAYNDYPVVGITYMQAVAFCHWWTQRINDALSKSGQRALIRIPTEAEWEYAAQYEIVKDVKNVNDEFDSRKLYPWRGYYLFNEKGQYMANSGNIYDKNGVNIKGFIDDGAFHTASAKSYPPNGIGLYNMAGNVAEWVMDTPFPQTFTDENNNIISVEANDEWNVAYDKTYKILQSYHGKCDTTNDSQKIYIKDRTIDLLHDAKILTKNKNARIIKGGSWFNSAVYLQLGSRQIFKEDKGSCMIGFRVVMELRVR